MNELTHRVAVAAYIFHDDRLLLLKRISPPQTFAPPGGRLAIGEDPMIGVLREVKEETGLTPEIIGIANAWYGVYTEGTSPLLCINYLATSDRDEPSLSEEHSDFVWATRTSLERGQVPTQDARGHGYRVDRMLDAFDRYDAWATIAKR